MTDKTPVPQEVQDKMQEGVRQRYALGTTDTPSDTKGVKVQK